MSPHVEHDVKYMFGQIEGFSRDLSVLGLPKNVKS